MKQKETSYKLDKKTGHLLEVPNKKQVRGQVKRMREKNAKKPQQKPQQAVTIHETQADKNFKKVQKVIDRMHAKAKLPDFLTMARKKFLSTVCVINKPGKERSLLPDRKGRHVMLCHRRMAKVFTADVCLLVKIQKSFVTTKHGTLPDGTELTNEHWQDGSWSIVPCRADKSNYTTIQEVRLRPWFFLHRYWYEISFDGHVEPAMMLHDYNLNPTLRKKHFYVTREFVKVRNQDAENDYFRFWLHKPTAHGRKEQ